MVSSRADLCARSMRLMWVRWRPASAASASCDSPRSSRSDRTISPNCSLNLLDTLDNCVILQTIRLQTKRNTRLAH